MPSEMVAAWWVGLKRIMSIAEVGGWARHIFLVVQSLLLLIGIIMSFVTGYGDRSDNLRIGFLAFALAVNFFERLLFWCVYAFSSVRDNASWNFVPISSAFLSLRY